MAASMNFNITPSQVNLIRRSFRKLAREHERFSRRFFNRLFELDPSMRSLFKADLRDQRRKMMHMMALIVKSLEEPDTLLPSLQDLGTRHRDYDIVQSHFNTFEAALIWALERELGDGFTPPVRDAWMAVYSTVAGIVADNLQK
jgi:hemoglobin-like flavoprotein